MVSINTQNTRQVVSPQIHIQACLNNQPWSSRQNRAAFLKVGLSCLSFSLAEDVAQQNHRQKGASVYSVNERKACIFENGSHFIQISLQANSGLSTVSIQNLAADILKQLGLQTFFDEHRISELHKSIQAAVANISSVNIHKSFLSNGQDLQTLHNSGS